MKPSMICGSLFVSLLLLPQLFAASSPAFKEFLAYAKWHQQKEERPKGRYRPARNKNPFDHSFGKKSIFGRLYKCIQEKIPMNHLIQDAARVEAFSNKRVVTVGDFDEAIACYQLSLIANEERAMLERLVTIAALSKLPINEMEQLLDYAKKRMSVIDSMRRMAGPGYSAAVEEMKAHAAIQELRLGSKDVKKAIKTVLNHVKKKAFDWRAVVNGAEAYSIAGKPQKALNLFARAFLLEPRIGKSIHKNPDLKKMLTQTDVQKRIKERSLCPKVHPCKFFGVTKVTVKFAESNFRTKINETRTINWHKDRFVEETNKVAIPGSVIKSLLRSLRLCKPSQTIKSKVSSQNVPSTLVRIDRKGKAAIVIFSASNDKEMFPYNIAIGPKLRYLATGNCGKILAFLRKWLAMSELRIRDTSPTAFDEIVTYNEKEFKRFKSLGNSGQGLQGQFAQEFLQVIDSTKELVHPPLPPNSQSPQGYDLSSRYTREKTKYFGRKETISYKKTPHTLTTTYLKNNYGSRWVNGTPQEAAKDAQLIEEAVSSFVGKLSALNISMASAKYTELGLPTINDIANAVSKIKQLNADWSALGKDLTISSVMNRNYGRSPMRLRASWLTALKVLIIDLLSTPRKETIDLFAKAIGANEKAKPKILKVAYNPREVVFIFTKETKKEEIDQFLAPCKEHYKVQTEEEKYRRNFSGANNIYISPKDKEKTWFTTWSKSKGLTINAH